MHAIASLVMILILHAQSAAPGARARPEPRGASAALAPAPAAQAAAPAVQPGAASGQTPAQPTGQTTAQTAPPTAAPATQKSSGAIASSTIDLRQHFEGFTGCCVLYFPDERRMERWNAPRCAERFPPCSTFKVPHALIAIDLGVVSGPDEKFAWDGVTRWNEAWNRDQTLRSSIRDSVLWCYQVIAKRIGSERMRAALTRIDYGNADCSGPIDTFWLGGPLLISADEQVAWMDRLRRGDLPMSPRAQEQVREMIVVDRGERHMLYGKTGTQGKDGKIILGWFVGWIESGPRSVVFAVNISAADEAWGPKAREIVKGILAERGLLPAPKGP